MSPSRRFLPLLLVILLTACAPAKSPSSCPAGPFAIYLAAGDLNGHDLLQADLTTLALQEQPVIASGEIFAYAPKTRELWLSPAAVHRLSELKVPVDGRAFVACAGGRPLFGGALWTYLSSLTYEGIAIMTPILPEDQSVRVESGYPTCEISLWGNVENACSFQDALKKLLRHDPLQDQAVLDVLHREGKLR